MCTHIPCCDPWRAGGVNRRPPPSAATDCPRPSSIPILQQHSQPSFLSRPPLLYPAAAKASSLSYRFQCPCRPEERTETSKTSPFCELIFHTSARRETDRACRVSTEGPSVNRTPGPSRRVFAADDGMTDQSTLDRTTFSSESEVGNGWLFPSLRARGGSSPSKKCPTSSRIYVESLPRVCIPASQLDLK